MAASRRSPLMRDQWRSEDHFRHDRLREDREKIDRRQRSPRSPRRAHVDLGVKIKGRATTVSDHQVPPCVGDRSGEARKGLTRERSRSGQRSKGEGHIHHSRALSTERHSEPTRRGKDVEAPSNRHRFCSRSPREPVTHSRHGRRRSPSPDQPRRTVKKAGIANEHRERRRGSRSCSRHPDRLTASNRHELASADLIIRDSYVPSSRRYRSRSPPTYRYPSDTRYRPRSRDRRDRARRNSPQYRRTEASNTFRGEQYFPRTYYDREALPRSDSRERHRSPASRRKPSSSPPHNQSARRQRARRHSRSPVESGRAGRVTRVFEISDGPLVANRSHSSHPRSPRQRKLSFDATSHNSGDMNQAFPMQSGRAGDGHDSNRPRPQVDTRQTYAASPPFMTPNSSQHGSPHSASPYGHGRGAWAVPQQFQGQPGINAYSPPYRQNSYPPPNSPYYPTTPQGHYTVPPPQMQPGYQNQSFRGGHSGFRGNHYGPPQDRRFSAAGAPYGINASRGRGGHFQNLQWTASGGSRGGKPSQPQSPSQAPSEQGNALPEDDNPFRPSKDLQVEDQSTKDEKSAKKMPPPHAKEGSKFSFAFKAKVAPPPVTKTVPDLTQRIKQPPRKESQPKIKPEPRSPPRDTTSSRSRTDRGDDRRDHNYRDERRPRDDRYKERDYRDQRRPDRSERRPARERERSPEIIKEKKIMKRLKPRISLPPEFAESNSVYYRKPGNESVVGSGTYGKVFKAIHVYTRDLVALKKIRMDGEKDGFPVTAVREIKLLQSLRHDNVVKLREVMVEKNDCFMVFEYLSHDLTGLLNHPTFKLENSHKKHLAKQLFEGLNYLHRRGVLHRDIKAANILVSNTGQLKLADFGLARFFAKRRQLDYTNRVITIWYRSPELLLGETQYGPAVDIWSAACVMVEIFTRHAIFPGDGGEINQLDKIYNVLGTPTRSEWPGLVDMQWFELLRPTEKKVNTFAEKYQERVSPAAFELLQAMLLYDPTKRPTAGDVLEHPYFVTEDPEPRQAVELKDLEGDWHEFESKALRKENERKAHEARKAVRQEEHQREKEKRRASMSGSTERDPKRLRPSLGPEVDMETT